MVLSPQYLRGASSRMLPSEQDSRLRQLFGAPLTAVGAGAQLLDLPASSVRDVLALKNPFDQWLAPFDQSRRIEGRDLLRQYGLAGHRDTWTNWTTGLGAEIALDPLTYLTFGGSALSRLGKAGKSAGLLDNPALRNVGPRTLRTTGTGEDLLDIARRAESIEPGLGKPALERLDEQAARMLGLEDYLPSGDLSAFEQLRAAEGDRLGSFGRFFGRPVGTGPVGAGLAQGVDTALEATGASALGRQLKSRFVPAVGGFTSRMGEEFSRLLRGSDEAAIPAIRTHAARLFNEREKFLTPAGEALTKGEYIQAVELVDQSFDAAKSAMQVSDFVRPEDVPAFQQHLTEVHGLYRDLIDVGRRTGNDVSEFVDDGIQSGSYFAQNYAARSSQVARGRASARGATKELTTFDRHNLRRQEAFRGFTEGTRGIQELTADGTAASREINDAIDALHAARQRAGTRGTAKATRAGPSAAAIRKAEQHAAEVIEKHYGPGTLPENIRTPEGSERARIIPTFVDEAGNEQSRYLHLARALGNYTRDERVAGLFSNDPIVDMQNRLIRGWHSQNTARVALRLFSHHAAPPGALGDDGVRIGDLMKRKNLALRGGDAEGGALATMARDFMERGDELTDDVLAEIADLEVPRELADTLERIRAINSRTPGGVGKVWDSYTNWFKSINTVLNSIPPVSAFSVRNLYSGMYNNLITGNFSARALRNAMEWATGKAVKGSSEWPAIRDAYRKAHGSLEGLTDETATEIIQELTYGHNVLGEHFGQVETGALRTAAQTQPLAMELPGQQPFSLARTGRRMLAREPGLTFNPLDVRGVGTPSGQGGALGAIERFTPLRAGPQQVNTRFGLMKAGEDVNGLVETVLRGTPWFHQLRRGVDPAEAARRTGALQVDYSWRNYTDFEREVLTRAFPFYKWTSRMVPWTLRELMEKPGGGVAQTLRAEQQLTASGDQYVPERLQQGLATPLPGLGENYWLTQIDLPPESALAPFQLGPAGQGVLPFLSGTMSRTLQGIGGMAHPTPKSIVEGATGTQLFSGRDLERLDGGVNRIYRNVGDIIESLTGREVPDIPALSEGKPLQNVLWSHIGGPLTKLRTLTDVRELRAGAPGAAKMAANLMTGVRISNIDPQQSREIEAQQKLVEMLRGRPGLREFTKPYVREEDLQKVHPRDRELLELLNSLRRR